MVLELPYPWCSASADYFAMASTYIADDFGDVLFFGSESADIEKLKAAADICQTESFEKNYNKKLKNGDGSTGAFLEILKGQGISGIGSNDLLGISYIRAINRQGLSMTPLCTARLGASYNSVIVENGQLPSATAIRELISQNDWEAVRCLVPQDMYRMLLKQNEKGTVSDIHKLERLILGYFRLTSPDDLHDYAEAGGGVANRLCNMAAESVSVDEFYQKIRTKRYTDSKLHRAILFCMTKTRNGLLREMPKYTQLLAANEAGCRILSSRRKSCKISVVTKPADAPKETEQYMESEKLEALWSISLENPTSASHFLQMSAYIKK